MKPTNPSNRRQTRFVFRVLAGIMAAIVLLISLPVALLEAWTGSLVAYFFVVCCIFAGIGFAQAAFTGRWFNSPS